MLNGKALTKIELKIVPSINSSNIYLINENTEFIVKEIINKWSYIETKDSSGWILSKKINSFFNSESASSGENKEQKQEETKINEDNSNTEKKEEKAVTSTETKQLNEKKYVSVDTLNFRTEPSSNAKIISQLKINSEVTVTEKTNDEWSKIKYKDTIGYVSSKYLSDKKVETTSRSEAQSRENKKEETTNTNNSTNNQTTTNNENTNTKTTESKQEESKSASSTATSSNQPTTTQPKETTTIQSTASATQTTATNNSNTSSKGAEVAAYAKQFLGNPYVYGGTSLTKGCDCSGFVMSVYAHFGYSLPHGSNPIATKGVAVSKANLQPGDVLIFTGHCGIYLGGNEFIHAQSSATGIVITSLSSSYYTSRYQGARRIIN